MYKDNNNQRQKGCQRKIRMCTVSTEPEDNFAHVCQKKDDLVCLGMLKNGTIKNLRICVRTGKW